MLPLTPFSIYKNNSWSWESGSVLAYTLNMCEALGSIPSKLKFLELEKGQEEA